MPTHAQRGSREYNGPTHPRHLAEKWLQKVACIECPSTNPFEGEGCAGRSPRPPSPASWYHTHATTSCLHLESYQMRPATGHTGMPEKGRETREPLPPGHRIARPHAAVHLGQQRGRPVTLSAAWPLPNRERRGNRGEGVSEAATKLLLSASQATTPLSHVPPLPHTKMQKQNARCQPHSHMSSEKAFSATEREVTAFLTEWTNDKQRERERSQICLKCSPHKETEATISLFLADGIVFSLVCRGMVAAHATAA